MGIDIHAFNFIKLQSSIRPLGDVLTIGRQSLCVPEKYLEKRLGRAVQNTDGYCEPLLAALGAKKVASIDYSDYEAATYIGDLNNHTDIGCEFDSVIDSGSLEHIFDIASAFRNIIRFCKVGGRIIHILPVNNLSGHGFWQFTSDLIFSIYSEKNGFQNTQVYYASGIDFSKWYKAAEAKPGYRIETASVEPLILLCVTEKYKKVESLNVVQPFYIDAWKDSDTSKINPNPQTEIFRKIAKALLKNRGKFINSARNIIFVLGLITGRNRFSIKRFEKIPSDRDKCSPPK